MLVKPIEVGRDWIKRLYADAILRFFDDIDTVNCSDLEHRLIRLGKPIVPILVRHLENERPITRRIAARALYRIDRVTAKQWFANASELPTNPTSPRAGPPSAKPFTT